MKIIKVITIHDNTKLKKVKKQRSFLENLRVLRYKKHHNLESITAIATRCYAIIK